MGSKSSLVLTVIMAILLYLGWLAIKPASSTGASVALADNYYSVYFFKGEAIYPVKRLAEKQGGNLKLAIEALFEGPSEQEKAQGVFTMIPADIDSVSVRMSPSLATIVVDDRFKEISGGTTRTKAALAQIVYTATQFSIIKYVAFETETGESTLVIGGEGLVIDKPMNRDDFREEFE